MGNILTLETCNIPHIYHVFEQMNNSAWTYKTFLQKTCCCFIASLLLIARAVILLESWTRAQDLLENCHFTIILPFNVSFPSKKNNNPPELSPVPLGLSALLKWTPQGQRCNTKHPWRIQLQFVSWSAKKSKPNQLWVTRAFTRCSQPITFAFDASSEALPTWPFEVSHPSANCRFAVRIEKNAVAVIFGVYWNSTGWFTKSNSACCRTRLSSTFCRSANWRRAQYLIQLCEDDWFPFSEAFLWMITATATKIAVRTWSNILFEYWVLCKFIMQTIRVILYKTPLKIYMEPQEMEFWNSEIPFWKPSFSASGSGTHHSCLFRAEKSPRVFEVKLQFLAQEFGVMCEAWAHWQNQRNRYPKSSEIIRNHPKSSKIIQWLSSQCLSISQIWDGHVHDEASSANLRTAMSWIYQRLQVYCLQALSWSNWGKVIWCHMMSYVSSKNIEDLILSQTQS